MHYIVASSKVWHKKSFEKLVPSLPGTWHYVESTDELDSVLTKITPRYIFFFHWNWKVQNKIIENFECVCFHMTDLPFGRGGSPLQNLILLGKTETTLTAFRMINEMDAGPIYFKKPVALLGRAEDIYSRCGDISWEMVIRIIEKEPQPVEQKGEPIFFKRRKPEQSLLPQNESLENLFDFIRMLDAPTYPLAFIRYGNLKIEFSHAQLTGTNLYASVLISVDQNQENSNVYD